MKKVSELDAEVAGASGSVAGAVAVAAKKPEVIKPSVIRLVARFPPPQSTKSYIKPTAQINGIHFY